MFDTCKYVDSNAPFGHEEWKNTNLQSRKKVFDVHYLDHSFCYRSASEITMTTDVEKKCPVGAKHRKQGFTLDLRLLPNYDCSTCL
jgi:hypothetical protein